MTYGRNGKGTVVVCASGNAYPYTDVVFPANMEGTIAVGAIDKNGAIWDYTCRGNSLNLVAPSGDCNFLGDVVTTDRSAPKGINTTGNYMDSFGGTSAACPQVAGVAALMLSANPNLTDSQVRYILCNTARILDANGHDATFGYRLVNAYAAVLAALGELVSPISGPTIPGSPSTYSIPNLPSGWYVVWSMQGKTTLPNYCTVNYPAANQLQIDNSSKNHIKETLVAKVYMANGTLIKTQTKFINTANGFTGTYSQTIPLPYEVISGTINDGNIIDVEQGYNVTLTSTDFNGATISYESFDTPTISSSGNTVTVLLHTSTRFSNCWLHFVKGDKVIEFCLRADPALILDPILNIMPGNSGEGNSVVNFVLNGNAGSGERGLNDIESWSLSIYNYTTGELVCTQQVHGNSVSIDSSNWEPDVYIAIAKVGDKESVQKFNLK